MAVSIDLSAAEGKDDFPFYTLALLSACALATLFFYASHESEFFICFPRQPFQVYGIPALLSLFTHAGFPHLLSNGLILFFAGSRLEARIGVSKYLLLFFICGISGIAGQALVSPVGTIGASGAICGMVAAYLAGRTEKEAKEWPQIWLWVFFWFSLELFWMADHRDGLIGHGAHIAGALTGSILGSLAIFQSKQKSVYENRNLQPSSPTAAGKTRKSP